jgi:hypothetical protein
MKLLERTLLRVEVTCDDLALRVRSEPDGGKGLRGGPFFEQTQAQPGHVLGEVRGQP